MASPIKKCRGYDKILDWPHFLRSPSGVVPYLTYYLNTYYHDMRLRDAT